MIKTLTNELLEKVCLFSNGLKSLGIKKGDRICIYLLMIPEFVIVTPEGTVNVSPESPRVNAVPVAGLILLVFTSLLMV